MGTTGVISKVRYAIGDLVNTGVVELTYEEETLLEQIDGAQGMLRKLMSSDEIKIANSLVKRGLLYKGISDDKQRTVVFYKY